MKTFKKSVALFLSVLMLLSMLTVAASVTAFAADQATVTIKANPGVFNTVQKTVNVGDEIVVTLNLKSDNLFVSGQFDFDYDKSVFKVTNQEDILYDVVIPDPDIYDYDGSALFTNGSKGIKMTEKTPVYSTTFKVLKATGNLTLTLNTRILIGTKGKASNSADELVYIADGEWSIKEGYEESIDVEVVPGSGQDDPVKPDPTDTTIYFIASGDAANWGEYHAHMWNEAGATTEWPGVAMTKTSQKTSAGYAIYSVTFTDDYDTVIFVKNKDDESGKAQATIQAGKYYDYASRKWLDKPDDTPQTDVLGTGLFVRGDFNAWNPVDSYEFKKTSASSNTARLSINVTTVKDYAFKVADASWGSSNYGGTATFTRTSNKATLENGNQSNLTLSADKAGTYVFEFNMSTAELTVTFPDGSVTPKPTEAESKPSTGGTITFKFTNNQGWDKIYVHSWGADGDLTTWPGNQMTESETNGYGETVYTITIPANAKGCVINNGDGAQTVDIENFNVEGYYTDGTKDDKEHFYVFPWGGSGEGDETTPSGSSKDFYLFGMINGVANVGEGEDNWQNLTDYKFTYVGNNTYTTKMTVTAETYVAVKTGDNSKWYMTNDWQGFVNSATLYETKVYGLDGVMKDDGTALADKLWVDNGEITFTLVDNGDDTLQLSYTKDGSVTPTPGSGETGGKDYYIFGMINGVANVGEGEDNWQNLTDYKFTYVGNNTYTTKMTVFDQTYVAVKTGDNQKWYMTNDWQGFVNSATLYETKVYGLDGVMKDDGTALADKLWVDNGEITFTLVDNGDDTLQLSYVVGGTNVTEPTEPETPAVTEPTEPETPAVTEPTESETPAVTEPTESETPVVTEPTEPETPAVTEPTEPETPAVTEPTESETPVVTEPTESETPVVTEPTTEPETEEPTTEPTTEPVTGEPITEPTTEPVTEEPITEPTTEPVTEEPTTEPVTEEPSTEPSTPGTTTPAPTTPAPTTPAPKPTNPPSSKPNATQPVKPATDLGKGASGAAVQAAILAMKNDSDPKGSTFNLLQVKNTKTTKNSIKLSYKKPSGTKTFAIYAAKCGTDYKMIKTIKAKTFTYKGLKKNTYYKFLVVALDKNGKVVATSKTIHVATKGGKNGNPSKVKITNASSAQKLAKGKSITLKTKVTAPKSVKVKNHRKVKFESSNTKILKVTNKGKVTAKKKGTATIYAYAQNGVMAKIKIKVS